MSDVENPYKAPETEAAPLPGQSEFGLTESMKKILDESSPWIEFIAVLAFIGTGLIGLIGIVFLVFGGVSDLMGLGMDTGAMGPALGSLYIILAAVMFFPARFLWLHGKRLKSFKKTGLAEDFEASISNAKSLWKFYGIVAIVYIAFIALAGVVGIIIAIVGVF